jgi:hypothetical protein
MRRRGVLGAVGVTLAAGLAGCSGASGSAPAAPEPDRDPVTLLPPTPGGMTEVRRTELPPGDTGAVAGAVAEFRAEPGVRYYTEVLRWLSEERASEGVSIYVGGDRAWSVYVTNGRFSWAGASVDGTRATLLDILGSAEGLTRSYVDRTDAIGES